MRTAILSAITLAASVLASASQAAVAFDNGPIGVSAGWCDSGVGQCGGGSWTIADNFSLSTKSVVTGLDTWNGYGNIGDYVSTNWSIWASQPTGLTAPIASGNAVGTVSMDSGFMLAAVSGLSVTLDAGSYWIGFSHQLTGATPWTYVTSLSGQNDVIQLNGNYINTSNQTDAAFRIHATAVPEPSSLALIMGGLAVVGVAARRRAAR